jgi:hypothetical protein
MACQEKTEAHLAWKKPTVVDTKHEAAQEVPKENGAVMPVRGSRKRRRNRNLAAGRRQKSKNTTRDKYESRKRLAVTCRGTNRRAKVARQKEEFVRRNRTRVMRERTTQRVRPLRKNLRTHHKGKRGTKDLGAKWPLYVRKKRETVIDIRGWSSRQLSPLGRRGSAYKTLEKTLELEFVKRATGMFGGLREVRNSTLWRYQHPPERQNKDWLL